jgi:hypothetical protein
MTKFDIQVLLRVQHQRRDAAKDLSTNLQFVFCDVIHLCQLCVVELVSTHTCARAAQSHPAHWRHTTPRTPWRHLHIEHDIITRQQTLRRTPGGTPQCTNSSVHVRMVGNVVDAAVGVGIAVFADTSGTDGAGSSTGVGGCHTARSHPPTPIYTPKQLPPPMSTQHRRPVTQVVATRRAVVSLSFEATVREAIVCEATVCAATRATRHLARSRCSRRRRAATRQDAAWRH